MTRVTVTGATGLVIRVSFNWRSLHRQHGPNVQGVPSLSWPLIYAG
jgi:hypothetical protein